MSKRRQVDRPDFVPPAPGSDRLLVGVRDISRAAGASAARCTVSQWAKLPVDPLRVRYLYSVPRILHSQLVRWLRRSGRLGKEEAAKEERLVGLEAIGEAAEVGAAHASKLVHLPHDPLPVYRTTVRAERGTPVRCWAYRSAVEDWRDARLLPGAVERLLRAFRSGDYLGVAREAKTSQRAQSAPANGIPAELVSLLGLSDAQVALAASDPGLVRALGAWAARRRTARVALEEGAVRVNAPIDGVPVLFEEG